MKMSTLAREMHEEFMRDSTEYCCYCYEASDVVAKTIL